MSSWTCARTSAANNRSAWIGAGRGPSMPSFRVSTRRIRSALTMLLLALAVLAGCKSPMCVKTGMTTETPLLKDPAPLREMVVEPGGCSGMKVALIDVDGVLLNANQSGYASAGENPVEMFREKLDEVARSQCYCAVVLRINSPGGGVTASDMMRRDLMKFRARTGLPIVACLMDVGAGGAYYLATGADYLQAHPTTVLGGMGVLMNVYNFQELMNMIGLDHRTVRAGKLADLGSPLSEANEEEFGLLQKIAEEFHQRFQDVVVEARGLDVKAFEASKLLDGRVFTAQTALAHRLIDDVGYLDDALQQARNLGGCADAKTVILHRCKDPAHTPYAITPNIPKSDFLPLSIPGLDRSRLPTFLYMWQPDPTLERWGGR